MYKNYARIALLLITVFVGFCIYFTTTLRFDYNFENLFPQGDEDLDYFMEFREKFGNDNDYLLIGIKNEEGIFQQPFLQKLDGLTRDIQALPSVVSITSPTNLKNPIVSPGGLIQVPVLHVNEPERYADDSTLVYNNPAFVKSFFSQDGKSVALMVQHTELIKKNAADSLTASIETLLSGYEFEQTHIAGKAKAFKVYIDKMQWELGLFMGISIVLVIIFLTITYQSFYGVIVPLMVVLLSTLGIVGIMGMMDKPLDVMMVLLPTIMFVVGMSDVVHIQTKYIEELRNGANKIKALKTTFKEVGLATFLTSLTTAAGFLTLMTASISPIREFGIYTALGVFIALIMAFTLLPAILLFTAKPSVVFKTANKTQWIKFLATAFINVIRYRKPFLFVMALLTGISIVGISLIKINTFILEDIPNDDPLREDFNFFEKDLGGARPFEMTVWLKDSSKTIYDQEVLAELEKVEDFLTSEYGVANILSPNFGIKTLNKALNGGLQHNFLLPQTEKEHKKAVRFITALEKRNGGAKITADGNKTARISGKMGDVGSAQTAILNEKLKSFFSSNINSSLLDYRLTGTSYLVDKNNEYLSKNMLQGLLIAFAVIALIAGLMFKSLRMILITLIPNIIPLIFVAGIMGYFGISLKVSTSIIFTIAFGIAVDDTIHFISKLKIELNKGKSLLYAIKRTYLSTGKAIIITTIILAGGFLTLILSSFGGTFYTGLLVSLTLIFAVIIDLTLLPILVLMFYKKQ